MNNTGHIKGIDGLRYIGVFFVISFHVEWLKSLFNISSMANWYQQTQLVQGVMTMYFVISGFIITYILLEEKGKTGTIDVKKFYKKRMRRIWPVYYLTLFMACGIYFWNTWPFTAPKPIGDTSNIYWVLLISILPLCNLVMFFSLKLQGFGHAWSLGTEQQFYIIWPLIIKKARNYLKIFILIICIKVFLKIIIGFSYKIFSFPPEYSILLKHFENFLFLFRIEAFGIGGIAAYLLIEKKELVLKFIYQRWVQWLNALILVACMFIPYKIETLHVLYSINFGIIILNMAYSNHTSFIVNNKFVSYVSKVSYGVYMYQVPIMFVVFNLLTPYYSEENNLMWNIAAYLSCILCTFIFSGISFEFMEKKIMAWGKNKGSRTVF